MKRGQFTVKSSQKFTKKDELLEADKKIITQLLGEAHSECYVIRRFDLKEDPKAKKIVNLHLPRILAENPLNPAYLTDEDVDLKIDA